MKFLRKLRALLFRRRLEREMAEEMRAHLEAQAEANRGAGMEPAEAIRRAQRDFGQVDGIQERCREMRGLAWLAGVGGDLRFATRLLGRKPGFTATALGTLALCLGANLLIFAFVDPVLFRPLPFPAADRLVTIYNSYPQAGVKNDGANPADYYGRRNQLPALSALALLREGKAVVGETGATARESALWVTPGFFAVLGRGPAVGRDFTEDEANPGNDRVVIVSDEYRRTHFAPGERVLGADVRIEGLTHTVVGVLPPGFRFLSTEAQLFLPLSSTAEARSPAGRHQGSGAVMIGRLAAGATIAEAQAQVDVHNAVAERDNPRAEMMAAAGFRSVVLSLHEYHVAAIRPVLLILQASALFLLLIGVANLANLLLVRTTGRVREFAIRAAIGAGRRRIALQVLTETMLLTTLGGILGIGVAAAGLGALTAFAGDRLPLAAVPTLDWRVAAAALLGSAGLGVLLAVPVAVFGLGSRRGIAGDAGSRDGTAGRGSRRLRHGFIVAQTALAFVLLTGSGLLGLSLSRALEVSPGFRTEGIIAGQVSLPAGKYPDLPALVAFTERLQAELQASPGVAAAGISTNFPLSGNRGMGAVTVKGRPRPAGSSIQAHYIYSVTGDYFQVLGLPVHAGRALDAADSRRAERVCVVDDDFARRYWPDSNPIGQRLFFSAEEEDDSQAFTVVGVVGAQKQVEVTDLDAAGTVYFPLGHVARSTLYVSVRTSQAPEDFGPVLQAIVRRVDPELPVSDLRTMDTRRNDSLSARLSSVLLLGIFSSVAVALAALGTYGVLSFTVAQQQKEIGIRLALGALPGQIRRHILKLGTRLLVVGLAIGLAGAWVVGRALRGTLFGVPPLDAATLGAALAVIALVSFAASWLPARRAARVDPMAALRSE